MDAEKDYNLLSEIMHNANIGWWKADIQDADYIYYGPIASLLGLEEGGCISFENFNKRILREEQPHTTVRSFDNIQQTNETVYLPETSKDRHGSAAKSVCKKPMKTERPRFTA